MIISGRENWLPYYRKDKNSIWISATLSDGEIIFFKEDDLCFELNLTLNFALAY